MQAWVVHYEIPRVLFLCQELWASVTSLKRKSCWFGFHICDNCALADFPSLACIFLWHLEKARQSKLHFQIKPLRRTDNLASCLIVIQCTVFIFETKFTVWKNFNNPSVILNTVWNTEMNNVSRRQQMHLLHRLGVDSFCPTPFAHLGRAASDWYTGP